MHVIFIIIQAGTSETSSRRILPSMSRRRILPFWQSARRRWLPPSVHIPHGTIVFPWNGWSFISHRLSPVLKSTALMEFSFLHVATTTFTLLWLKVVRPLIIEVFMWISFSHFVIFHDWAPMQWWSMNRFMMPRVSLNLPPTITEWVESWQIASNGKKCRTSSESRRLPVAPSLT